MISKRKLTFLFYIFILFILTTGITLAHDWVKAMEKVKSATAVIVRITPNSEDIKVNAPIVDALGLILTNWHVGESLIKLGEQRIKFLIDGQEYKGEIHGYDARNDLCLIKLKADHKIFPYLKIALQGAPLGTPILCLGAPLAREFTLVDGFVGRVWRDNEADSPYEIIQHSAEIFYGNSGSAIVNSEAEIVGLNFAIYLIDGLLPVPGQYYAIPVDLINESLPRMQKGLILDAEVGLKVILKSFLEAGRYGLLVKEITDDSIFRESLKINDIIKRIGPNRVHSLKFLEDVVRSSYLPGEQISLTILRKDKNQEYQELKIEVPVPDKKFKSLSDHLKKKDKEKKDSKKVK